jgi:hypothetical protein
MTDNQWSHTRSADVAAVLADLRATNKRSGRTGPGKTGKSNASTAACKPNGPTGNLSISNEARTAALARRLATYNNQRLHTRGAISRAAGFFRSVVLRLSVEPNPAIRVAQIHPALTEPTHQARAVIDVMTE